MEWKFSLLGWKWDEMDKAIHTQEDLLKGRESWQTTLLKNELPGQMESAREQLLAVAPLADPSRVKMYNKFQEEKLALAVLAGDRQK